MRVKKEMGSRVSRAQRDVYCQVKHTLRSGEKSFSKRDLRAFIRWIFLNFLHVSVLLVGTVDFWDRVERVLHRKVKDGEINLLSFMGFCCSIVDSLEKRGVKCTRKKSVGTPVSPSHSNPPCPPYTPSPIS